MLPHVRWKSIPEARVTSAKDATLFAGNEGRGCAEAVLLVDRGARLDCAPAPNSAAKTTSPGRTTRAGIFLKGTVTEAARRPFPPFLVAPFSTQRTAATPSLLL